MFFVKKIFHSVCLISFFVTGYLHAEPTSSAITLASVRPYGNGDTAFVTANITAGSFCALNFYSINLASNSGRAMYATALLAVSLKKVVKMEISGCGNGEAGSNLLHSITLISGDSG